MITKLVFTGLMLSLSVALLTDSTLAKDSRASGHGVFMHSGCFACHGQLGYGGAGPGFRGDKMLAARDYVIDRILLGGGIMPAFDKALSDQEIAAVATYIRMSCGNKFGPVDQGEVAKARNTLANSKAGSAPGIQGVAQ